MPFPSFVSQFIIAYSHWFPNTRQSWLESPQILVERLATAVVALQLLQFVLYAARSGSSSHWPGRWCAWAAFYLPVPLAAVAVAVMLRLRWRCPYWLVAVFFAAGQADTVAAYSLRDADKQSVRRFAKRALSLAYPALALFVHGDGAIRNLGRKEIFSLVLGFLVVLQDLKICRRAMASPSEICKFAADHVRFHRAMPTTLADDDEEPSQQQQQPQARRSVVAVGSLESYRSAVSGCTTLEDIRTSMSASRLSSRLDDACLSSALFLQLLQRYDGRGQVNKLECSSANHAFRDVLAEARGWKRALRLVDAQLSLMKDYFFSVHGSPTGTSYRLYLPYSLLKIGFVVTVRSLAMEEKPAGRFTSAALHALIVLELCQLFGYLMSDRFLVAYMCVCKEDLGGTAGAAPPGEFSFSSVVEELVGWKGCLEQYSLVEDFDRAASSLKQRLMARLKLKLGRRCRRVQQTQRRTSRTTPASSFQRSLQFQELKRWIICDKAFPASERHRLFSFDVESMWVCEPLADALSWTLSQETRIHTILIWHVATWFCDMSSAAEDAPLLVAERIFPAEYTFATMLSSYCAYLVAYRPELLPEHHALTASILDEAVEEAAIIFGPQTPPDERYTTVKSLLGQRRIAYLLPRQGIFKQGMKLGHQLMGLASSERWEIMADFWAEMTLLLAQTGDAAAHVERLPSGGAGDFVTQLWALLSNGWDRSFIRRNSDDGSDRGWDAMLRAGCLAIGGIIEHLQ